MLKLLNSFSRINLSSKLLRDSDLPSKYLKHATNSLQSQPIRFINKQAFETESGWKAFGYKWIVKFPEKYTTKKLPLMKLAGRDPITGNDYPTHSFQCKLNHIYYHNPIAQELLRY